MSQTLPSELISYLQGEPMVTLITLTGEGKPHVATVSWVGCNDEGTVVRIAVGHKATSADNLVANPHAVLSVTGGGSTYAITGSARVSDIISKSMKYRVIEVAVGEVEENMFYGGKVVAEAKYIKTYNQDLAEKLDQEVAELLKENF